jgi:drug/metabolite transporter (DMT)-like permease
MSQTTKGILSGIVSAVCYGVIPLFTLPLYKVGQDVDSVLFYRYTIAVAILGVLMRLQHQSFRLRRYQIVPLMVMGCLFSVSSCFLFTSYHYMDGGIASTILFVYPVLVAIIMAIFFKERMKPSTTIAILLATIGIALLCRPGDGARVHPTGILLVGGSALTYALYIVGVNRSSLKELPNTKMTFYALLFGVVFYAIRLQGCTQLIPLPDVPSVCTVVALAIFPTVISLITMARSIQYIGSTPTAILGALEPVTALIFGAVVFGEVLTPRILLGVLLVILAVTAIVVAPVLKKLKSRKKRTGKK